MAAPLALLRELGPGFESCQLTWLERRPIDLDLARRQHRRYREALEAAGWRTETLAADPGLPDAVFVEDTAVILDEAAVVCRPGAASRRPETRAVAAALRSHRPLERIGAPATLDGGDVLRLGRRLWVGLSSRTNASGAERLAAIARRHGYTVSTVGVERCLHLKSAVTALDPETVLVNPAWVDTGAFAGVRLLEIDPAEPHAANALAVPPRLIYPAEHRRTAALLDRAGYDLLTVEVSEIAKAEGGVTCCSLLLS